MIDEATHSRLRDTAPPKDLHHIPYRILRTACALHLQKSKLAGKVRTLFLLLLKYKSLSFA